MGILLEAPARPTALRDLPEPSSGARERDRVSMCLSGVVALPFVLWTIAIVRASHEWLATRLPDDAYYYLEIGQRLSEGGGSSFDGIHQTNGYHPAWQAINGVLALAFQGDVLVRAVLLVSLAFVGVSTVLLVRLLAPRTGRRPALVGVAVALHAGGLGLLVNGMETPLVLLAALVVATVVESSSRDQRKAAKIGLACGGLVLARLDYLLAVMLMPVVLGWTRDWRVTGRWLVAFLVVVGPVFAWNQLVFGSPLSVSGTLKLHWMAGFAAAQGGWLSTGYAVMVGQVINGYVHAAMSMVGAPSGLVANADTLVEQWLGGVLLVGGAAAALILVIRHPDRPSLARTGLGAGLILMFAKSAVDFVVLPRWALGWYAGPSLVIAVACTIAVLVAHLSRAARGTLAAGLIVGPFVLLLGLPTEVPATEVGADASVWQGGIDQVAEWLHQNPQPGRLGAFDAGLLGFSLHPVPVVNLDGLVNDADHARAVIAGVSPTEMLRRNEIDYLVGRLGDDDARVPSCATDVWRSSELIGSEEPGDAPTYVAMRVIDVRCVR
jgi:hypothetical protein